LPAGAYSKHGHAFIHAELNATLVNALRGRDSDRQARPKDYLVLRGRAFYEVTEVF